MGFANTLYRAYKKISGPTSNVEGTTYINETIDRIDADINKAFAEYKDNMPDTHNAWSLGSAIRNFLNGYFNQLTLGGVTRSTWPAAGSGSQSMDDTYNNGSVIVVDNTNEAHRLSAGKKQQITDSTGATVYLEVEGGKGASLPNTVLGHNLISNSRFLAWSNGTVQDNGINLLTNGSFSADAAGWSADQCTLASVAGGAAGNCLEITRTAGSSQTASQTFALPTDFASRTYKISGYVKSGTAGNETYMAQISGSVGSISMTGTSSSSWAAFSGVFAASSQYPSLNIAKQSSTAGTMWFDEIWIYEVFPGCVAADDLGPDGWGKSGGATLRQELNTANIKGFAGMKLSFTAVGTAFWPKDRYNKTFWRSQFAGRTIVFGAWVKTSTANHIRLAVYDTTYHYSIYHSGGGGLEWLEVSIPSAASPSEFTLHFTGAQSSGDAYVSQPYMFPGAVIGSGNSMPIVNEIMAFETPFVLANYSATAKSTGTSTINMRAESYGRVPICAKRVQVTLKINDSGSAAGTAYAQLGPSAGIYQVENYIQGVPNDVVRSVPGWVNCNASGDIYINMAATGSNTLDISITVHAMEVA